MIRLLLPPNLPAAAQRDAVAVQVRLDPAAPLNPAFLPGLATLQRLCGGAPQPPPFIQLNRAQLAELVTAFHPLPVFAFLPSPDKPLLWIGPLLRGVSEHLERPAPPPSTTPSSPPTPARPTPPPRPSRPREPATPLLVDGSEHYLALTLPSREHSAYPAALAFVKTHGFILDPASRKWWLRDRHKTLNLLASHLDTLRHEFFADFTPNFEKHTAAFQAAEFTCEITPEGENFSLTLGLAADSVSEEKLRLALATGRGYVEAGGRVHLLSPSRLEQLAQAQRILAGGPATPLAARRTGRISPARVAELHAVVESLLPGYRPPVAWARSASALRDLSTLTPTPLPAWFAATLRPYQALGVAWLRHLHRHRLGGILADEMGLGKTAQALALLASLSSDSSPHPRPHLVVCPASLAENWRREAARFAPGLKVFVHHGPQRLTSSDQARQHHLIITSYGTLVRDQELFADLPLDCLVADEAQHVKNRRTQNARALRTLDARARFLLTGTPVENSLDDLRALFEILLPGYLATPPTNRTPEDRAWFDQRLRAQTAPYILRRTKLAVAPELPAKIEQTLWCEPSPAQHRLYLDWQRASEQELDALTFRGASENSLRLATLTQLLRLRQICCDPRLVQPDAPADSSAKLDAFRELLAEAIDDGHRLLVFSQFTSLLALVRAELEAQEISFCQLDGSLSPRQRQAQIDRFETDPSIPVFLLSLKAGGTGLNLTGADTVVHFDPWWNPAVEAQATDRAHRIGQTRIVTSYKLICTGTVEEKVLAMQEEKRRLLADVFEASDAASAQLSLGDLRDLLK